MLNPPQYFSRASGQTVKESDLPLWMERGWLGLILVGAVLTYLVSILPHVASVHSGDEANFIETALRMGSGTLEPFGLRHGTGLPMLLLAEFGLVYLIGWMQGTMHAPIDVAWLYLQDPGRLFLMGRLTALVVGGVVIGLTYLIGRRLVSPIAGLLAATFLGLCFLPVTLVARFKEEFMALALLLLAFLGSIRLAGLMGGTVRHPRRLAFWIGLALGAASACKYTAVLGGTFVALGVVWSARITTQQSWETRWRHWILTGLLVGVGAALGFFLLTPALLTEGGLLVRGMQELVSGYTEFAQPLPPTVIRLSRNLPDAVGMPLAILMGIGSIWGVWRRDRTTWLLLMYPVMLMIFLVPYIPVASHLMLALPFLCLIAADGLTRLVHLFHMPPRLARLYVVVVAGVILWHTYLDTWRFISVLRRPDTRLLAQAWVEQHVPHGAHLLVEGARYRTMSMGPELPGTPDVWREDLAAIEANGGRGRLLHMRWAFASTHPPAATFQLTKVFLATAEMVEALKPAYVVTTGYFDEELFEDEPTYVVEASCSYHLPEVRRQRPPLHALLQRDYLPVASFDPGMRFHGAFPELSIGDFSRLRRLPLWGDRTRLFQGPLIRIYERNDHVRQHL